MSEVPHFSIVIPTYRRVEQLYGLLSSLTQLKFSLERFEVIIVDDGSLMSLENVSSQFGTQLDLTLLRQTNQGPAAARNKGATKARGQFIAFTDDDCIVDTGWLKAMEDGLLKNPQAVCGGKTVNLFNRNPYSTASQLLLEFLSEHYSPQMHLGGFFPTLNFAVPRTKFMEVGGFDPHLRFGEDRDFCHRWALKEYPFCSVPKAVVYHAHPLSLSSFLSLHFCYGGGTYQFRRRCIDRKRPPKINPPSFYLRLILSGIIKQRSIQGSLLSLLLLVSQGANAGGFFWEALKRHWSSRL